jgi:hypothetical protein
MKRVFLILVMFLLVSCGGISEEDIFGEPCEYSYGKTNCADEDICLWGTCVVADETLTEYIEENYEQKGCQLPNCERCDNEQGSSKQIGNGSYSIEFCVECKPNSTISACKEEYDCVRGYCI